MKFHVMPQITFKTLSNIQEAEAAWKALSPNKSIYDEWDFRFAYFKYFNYPLEFIAGYDGDTLIGLLPLMWNPEKKYLEFFMGVDYMEDNQIFVKPGYESYRNEFIKHIDKPAYLEYMPTDELTGSVEYDYNYSIDLTNLTTYNDFISTYLGKDTAKNVSSQMKKIESHNPHVTVDDLSDLSVLKEWSIRRFGNHSSYSDRPHWEEFINDVSHIFEPVVVTVTIDGKKEAVGFALIYKNVCYGINAGYNEEINNLGKYITMMKIQEAIKRGCSVYNAGSGAYGWKDAFHLIKRPFYKLDLTK